MKDMVNNKIVIMNLYSYFWATGVVVGSGSHLLISSCCSFWQRGLARLWPSSMHIEFKLFKTLFSHWLWSGSVESRGFGGFLNSSPGPWQYMQVALSLFQNAAPITKVSLCLCLCLARCLCWCHSPGSTFLDLCFSWNGKHSFSA